MKRPTAPIAKCQITWTPSPPGTSFHTSNTGCRAVVSTYTTHGHWHLFVDHPDRYPTLDELASARDEFVPPDVQIYMGLPRPDEYGNPCHTMLHLWAAPILS